MANLTKEKSKNFIFNSFRNKNFIVFGWLGFLGFISILAIGGTFSTIIEGMSNSIERKISSLILSTNIKKYNYLSIKKFCEAQEKAKFPTEVFRCYIYKKYDGSFISEVPPIASVLDDLQKNYSWRQITVLAPNKNTEISNDKFTEEELNILFEIVENKLTAISADSLQDINNITITNEILPAKFRLARLSGEKFEPQQIPLPLEAKNWIRQDKNRIKQLALADTFFLLLMLGAFGSLIFLISEHMKNEDDISIKHYYFRPIFGMLLAVATFIVNISFNSVTSTATIENVRFESLLILAFAAGLLSDKAYEMLTRKAEEAQTSLTATQTTVAATQKTVEATQTSVEVPQQEVNKDNSSTKSNNITGSKKTT